jgi:hypothetical protein
VSNYISWVRENIPDWTQPPEPTPTPTSIPTTTCAPTSTIIITTMVPTTTTAAPTPVPTQGEEQKNNWSDLSFVAWKMLIYFISGSGNYFN